MRRQVCGFANSHDGGYLILGAEDVSAKAQPARWVCEGMRFPDEPITWVTNVVGALEGGVRPQPDFDVKAWSTPAGHVAVVNVRPTSTPPCIANGTVYERRPGKTDPVRDPLRLAALYARGDEARRSAGAGADLAAQTVIDMLHGDAGVFRTLWVPVIEEPAEEVDEAVPTGHISFAVGLATTGNPPNIAGRLFQRDFSVEIWERLRDRPPPGAYRLASRVLRLTRSPGHRRR